MKRPTSRVGFDPTPELIDAVIEWGALRGISSFTAALCDMAAHGFEAATGRKVENATKQRGGFRIPRGMKLVPDDGNP